MSTGEEEEEERHVAMLDRGLLSSSQVFTVRPSHPPTHLCPPPPPPSHHPTHPPLLHSSSFKPPLSHPSTHPPTHSRLLTPTPYGKNAWP